MKTPDITPVQIVAAVTALVGLFVSQGVLDGRLEQLIVGVASIVVPFVWMLADAVIRHGRSQIAAAQVLAAPVAAPTTVPVAKAKTPKP